MLKMTGLALSCALMLLACSACFVFADEARMPTPEEFREQVRQYNEKGMYSGRPHSRQVTAPLPKAVEQFERALSLHTRKDASPGELREAASLYQAASDAGLPQACVNLAFLYLEGKGVKKDAGKAVSLLNKASKKNIPQADMALARLYLVGKDVKRDEKKGEWHLRKAAGTGNRDAVRMLAEYREWKKKNELAMKQYREILKNARMNIAKPGSQPSAAQSFQPTVRGYPFPVIPGQAYLGANQAVTPSAKTPLAPPAPPDKTGAKANAVVPQPVGVSATAEYGREAPDRQTQDKPADK